VKELRNSVQHVMIDKGFPQYSIREVRSVCLSKKTDRTELNSERE